MKSKTIGYIGTYTNGLSKGIYKFKFDDNDGTIDDISLAFEISNPTYLTINKSSNKLYSVSKDVRENNNIYGGVASFNINNDFSLSLTGKVETKGAPPCHVSLSNDNNYLFASNYHDKHITSYTLNTNKDVTNKSHRILHYGSSHVHFAMETPDSKFICVLDLGLDIIFIYELIDGELILNENLTFTIKKGSGPRHMVFAPNKRFAYILCELSSEVIILEYLGEKGFKILDYVRTLPDSYSDFNATAAIRITSNGKYLYCSNRGHNSIVAYEISKDGHLCTLNYYPTYGNEPRDFNLSPNENYLLIGNHKSDNLTVYKKSSDGQLILMQKDIKVPSPVCITFL